MERNKLINKIQESIKKVNSIYNTMVHLDCKLINSVYICIDRNNKIILDYSQELDLNSLTDEQLKDVYDAINLYN